jgi:hypothetical protein
MLRMFLQLRVPHAGVFRLGRRDVTPEAPRDSTYHHTFPFKITPVDGSVTDWPALGKEGQGRPVPRLKHPGWSSPRRP